MIEEQKYWNPVLETLPQEKIKKLQVKKFRRIFNWAYEKSSFHNSLYREAGIKPEDIQSLNDIRHIPTVEKSMMRDIQRKDPFPYLKDINEKIRLLKKISEDILEETDSFPALSRNCSRILASIKMMELNVSDI